MRFISGLVWAGCLLAGSVLAQSPVTVTIDTQSPGPAIPPDFLGLSFETANLKFGGGGVNGYMFDSSNAQLVTLFQNLGIKHLRIGGTSTDTNNSPIFPLYVPTNPDVDALFRFANAAGVKVVFSLRLENGDPAQDAAIASYVQSNYSNGLTCFAIGNEPNLYKNGDPDITDFSSYLAKWRIFAAAVTNVAPDAKFGGPDNSGGGGAAWASGFANEEMGSGIVTWIFAHDYIGGSSRNLTAQQVIEGALSASWDTVNYPSYYSAVGAVALADGFPYRMTELNSYTASYPGVWGGNNSFATALYAVDCAHWWAEHECGGVNFHTYLGKYNGTIWYDSGGNYQVYPMAYGIKAFDVGGHGRVEPATIANTNGLNLTAYAVDDSTNLYVTIVNREHGSGARSAAVSILPEGYVTGSAAAMFLVAPGGDVAATNGMTLGGATITNNVPWAGQWTALSPLTNGVVMLTVPAASAAVVRIHGDIFYFPPVIVRDLPARVPLTAGKSYRYSIEVKGGLPLSYQWYEGANPIAGATNASYPATAGAVGSTAAYSVVITNTYGAATSTVSILTIIPQLTDYYARQVLDYGPAGYWPLQETSAPAPATIETNYGTLGALGNAYYATTNATDVTFGQAGSLAGVADPAVAFQGAGQTTGKPDSYAFVPRVSPELTLRPPFSLEVWVNSATPPATGGPNTQDLICEGGIGQNTTSGGGTAAGIRIAWIYVNNPGLPNGPGFAMLGYYPDGSLFNYQVPVATPSQWYHCVLTYDGSTASLYVNGTLQAATNFIMQPDTCTPLTIGAGRWQAFAPTRGLVGREDEVAVYTNVLPAARINSHYLAGITSGSNYPQTVLADHPLLYYRMNCRGYTNPPVNLDPPAVNYGSASLNGAYPPGTVPGGVGGPPASDPGTESVAAPIDGLLSCIDAGYDPAFNPTGHQPLTAMIWVKGYPTDNRFQNPFGRGDTSWRLGWDSQGKAHWNAGAGGEITSAKLVNDGNWHFLAGVFDGNSNYLYIDGALDGQSAVTGTVPGNTNDVFIGGAPDYTAPGNQRYFGGAVAQAAFFTNALSAAAVQSIYNAAMLPPPPATIAVQDLASGQLRLNWNYGTLQSATNITGPYNDIPEAAPPYTISPVKERQFFRVRAN